MFLWKLILWLHFSAATAQTAAKKQNGNIKNPEYFSLHGWKRHHCYTVCSNPNNYSNFNSCLLYRIFLKATIYAVNILLCLLQGVHESSGPSLEYYHLERLVELVVSPYLSNVLHNRNEFLLGQ